MLWDVPSIAPGVASTGGDVYLINASGCDLAISGDPSQSVVIVNGLQESITCSRLFEAVPDGGFEVWQILGVPCAFGNSGTDLGVGLVPMHSFSLHLTSHIEVLFIGISAGRCRLELNVVRIVAFIRGVSILTNCWCCSQGLLTTVVTRFNCLFGMYLLRITTASAFHVEHGSLHEGYRVFYAYRRRES